LKPATAAADGGVKETRTMNMFTRSQPAETLSPGTAALGLLVKPSWLTSIEEKLTTLRDERAGLAAEYRPLCQAQHAAGATRESPQVRKLKGEIAALDDKIKLVRNDLAAARAEFQRDYETAIAPTVEAYRSELAELLDRISADLPGVMSYAQRNGLEAPRGAQMVVLAAKELRRFA
jgi:hypothetical protein